MVSVSIRETIMQLRTPDHVRGRVNAVNSVFIGAGSELGEFRAGMMAALIGAQAAVAFGAAATIAVAGSGAGPSRPAAAECAQLSHGVTYVLPTSGRGEHLTCVKTRLAPLRDR